MHAHRNALLILGMHRSGTSALTRTLSLLGGDLPQGLMPAQDNNNKTGFWESTAIMAANEKLLTTLNSSWDDWSQVDWGEISTNDLANWRKQTLETVHKEFDDAALPIIKDPRICRLVHAWEPLLEENGTPPLYIIPLRHPLEVAKSLQRRDDMPIASGLLLWLRHLLDAERTTRGKPRTVCSYESLLSDWRSECLLMSQGLNFSWPLQMDAAAAEVDGFLQPGLRHHIASTSVIDQTSWPVAELVEKCWTNALKLRSNINDASAFSAFDDLNEQLDALASCFAGPWQKERQIRRTAELQQQDAEQLRQSLEGSRNQHRELEGVAHERLHQIEVLQDKFAAQHERLGVLEEANQNWKERNKANAEEIEKLRSERESLECSLTELKEELESARSDQDALQKQLEIAHTERDKLITPLDNTLSERDALREKLEESNSQYEMLESVLRQVRAERDHLRLEFNQSLEDALESYEKERRTLESDLKDLSDSKKKAQILLAATRQRALRLIDFDSDGITEKPSNTPRLRFSRFALRIRKSKLFDYKFYTARYNLGGLSPDSALEHWLTKGWKQHYNPNPLFDTGWYLSAYDDVRASGTNPLKHYLRFGEAENRSPGPYFDPTWYRETYDDVLPRTANALEHFCSRGADDGLNPHPLINLQWYAKQAGISHSGDALRDYLVTGSLFGLSLSPLLDICWYLTQNPGLAHTDIDPLQHFLLYGAIEGLSPHPLFEPKWYAEQYPEASNDARGLFWHFFEHGARGYSPGPDFDADAYLSARPEVADSGQNPLLHFLETQDVGTTRNRSFPDPTQPNSSEHSIANNVRSHLRAPVVKLAKSVLPPFLQNQLRLYFLRRKLGLSKSDFSRVLSAFDSRYYLKRYLDVDLGRCHPFQHFMLIGWRSHRNPSPEFDTAYYLEQSPDIAEAGLNPFTHWVLHGQAEKRPALPFHDRLERHAYQPLVTAIVPNYNHAAYLRERLDSILNQSYDNIEILVLDDCSTDQSRDTIQAIADENPDRVRTDFNTQNAGNVFRQWRKGAEQANGELIWICESDDFCEHDFLENVVPFFRDRSVQIAFGRIQFSDVKGHFQEGLDDYREGAEAGIWDQPLVRPAHQWFQNGFGVNNVIANVGGCVWRKQDLANATWEQAETYSILGDWYLYLKLAGGGQIGYSPHATAYFRQHGQNTSVKSFQGAEYYIEHERLMIEARQQWNVPLETVEKFAGKVRWQYEHHKRPKALGSLEQYFSVERILKAQPNRPHILMAFLGFHPGGGEFFPIRLANSLHQAGITVSMLALDLNDINADMMDALSPSIAVYDAAWVAEYGADRFLAESGVSLIHSHMISLEWFFLEKCDITSEIPYVVTLHGSYEAGDIPKAQLTKFVERVDHWVYLADKNLKPFSNFDLPQSKFTKLPNAVPYDDRPFPQTREELGIAADAIVFTLVARGIQRKGWRAAVNAFIALRAKHPNTAMHLLLAGSGEAADQQKQLHGDHPDITFLGFQSCIQGLYRISDVALVPSRFAGESFPLCILEAYISGIPVISTKTGEIPSMVMPENSSAAGVLIEPQRDTQAFTTALCNAMESMLSVDFRQPLAEAARKLSKNSTMQALCESYYAIYESKS